MRSYSYLNSAKTILEEYKGEMPFAGWLKNYFKQHKKFGSRDRKEIAALCYGYFRLGGAFKDEAVEQRMLMGAFLSSDSPVLAIQELKPEWDQTASLEAKIHVLKAETQIPYIFPFSEQLSKEISRPAFNLSHLIQPYLYLRLRPGHEQKVPGNLDRSGIRYEKIGGQCLALAIGSKVEEIVRLNREAVIQDLNSQKVLDLIPEAVRKQSGITVWDCCAASGGKSILAWDLFQSIRLTVSDIRASIIRNLQKRFAEATIGHYQSFVADVSSTHFSSDKSFDLVICDAPCSGSGTWSRTPEYLRLFREEKINEYASLQKKIAVNGARSVRKGGYLLYITCSVFEAENEAVVKFIQEATKLTLTDSTYYAGYERKADTLFAALFQSEL